MISLAALGCPIYKGGIAIKKEHNEARKHRAGQKTGYKLATLSNVASSSESVRFAPKSKGSANYWQAGGRLFKFTRGKRTNGATVKEDADYSCRISFGNRREQFQLHTANKAEAATKAASIYRDVVGKGWEDALRIHKPKATPKPEILPSATIGSLIAANVRLSSARSESLEAYAKALRRIAGGVLEISGGKKFDGFQGRTDRVA